MPYLITALIAAVLAGFVWSLASLRHLPTGRQPCITIYDRAGRPVGQARLELSGEDGEPPNPEPRPE